MNADDAIRFLEHEGEECRRRLRHVQSVQDARNELEMFLLLMPPTRRRVLNLPAMTDAEAEAFRYRFHEALRQSSRVMTGAEFSNP